MRIGCVRGRLFLAGVTFACAGVASGYQSPRLTSSIYHAPIAGVSSLYELADPIPLSSTRWDPLFDSQIELATGLVPRHEVRLAAGSRVGGWGGSDMSLASTDSGWTLDPLRATYRYTFFERRDWAWKVGVTTRLGETAGPAAADRVRLGSLPLVHFAGEGRLGKNWLLTLDADGLMTTRGRALDLGVRVNYALTRSVYVFGGYRLSDHYLEGDETSPGLVNSANVGVRYRF
jgi:hypothetical protein